MIHVYAFSSTKYSSLEFKDRAAVNSKKIMTCKSWGFYELQLFEYTESGGFSSSWYLYKIVMYKL